MMQSFEEIEGVMIWVTIDVYSTVTFEQGIIA